VASVTGGDVLYSSGTCCEGETCARRGGSCLTDDDCSAGFVCQQNLVIAAAADSDGDELVDPLDNCPDVANADQADLDRDGIGDACDKMTCGNGVREFSEACDGGNRANDDCCTDTCQLAGFEPADVPRSCDASGDGCVDRTDIESIVSSRGEPAASASDPMDVDGDGVVTGLDARACVVLCDLAGCAERAPEGSVTSVPEPSMLLMLLAGVGGVVGLAVGRAGRLRRR
jgi:cysteine-rich repeat protein